MRTFPSCGLKNRLHWWIQRKSCALLVKLHLSFVGSSPAVQPGDRLVTAEVHTICRVASARVSGAKLPEPGLIPDATSQAVRGDSREGIHR